MARSADPPRPPAWKKDLSSVGVTGTNGKTSTTRFCAAALGSLRRPVASATTVGSFLDDEPFVVEKNFQGFLTLLEETRRRGGRLAAVEMTSEALARGIARAWPCEVAVFTNLTHDHLDAHGSPEHYLASKAQLFMALPPGGTAVLNGCDPSADLMAEVVPAHATVWRYGVRGARATPTTELELLASEVSVSWEGTRVDVSVGGKLAARAAEFPRQLSIAAVGSVFAENALGAYLAAVAAGAEPRAAAEALARAPVPPGRFEVVARAPHVVVDYAHTPDAIARTLRSARLLCKGKMTLVFGAGGNRDRAKRRPMGEAASAADRVVITSDNPRSEAASAIAAEIRAGVARGVDVVTELDRRRAIELSIRDARPGDVVIVAGRGHETEQIIGTTTTHFSDVEVVRELTAGGASSAR
jgi:UDP-N-acetylmuramoyl-L-alanyl-D-glutamate--2,6-diaminopimelate ligase